MLCIVLGFKIQSLITINQNDFIGVTGVFILMQRICF
jgi:hypothetical protein